jgi:hypothetical protein
LRLGASVQIGDAPPAAAFAVLIAIVVMASSNEKVSAMSAFSLERYLLSSGR